ncbi:hypothetical protein LAZ67_10002146 [Cordylochernes scorpioides]|uniref:Reverse transcriptase domain-containing protein n=1 Tax=Cordylochernes scorpioides TaxID=51811 RepID=A0ABY6KX04_9ARAC|nr:hypothetical protein LAZ67_10002146 [Cordylochernes scorpioides]
MQFFSNISSRSGSGVAVYYDSFCLMQGCLITLHRAEITAHEVATAIRHLSRGRAPGWDGLPCELLAVFEDFFTDALQRVFASSQLRGVLPPKVRRSAICLIPKARNDRGLMAIGQSRCLRPTTGCSRPSSSIAPSPIYRPWCQTYAVPGRSPSWNIAWVTDAVEEATAGGSPLAVVCVDLQSTFDYLDRGFLLSLMVSLRLPPTFVGWILLLYAGADPTIRAGGFQTTAFNLLNGVRQGCAVSAALFRIATGPLLRCLGNVIGYADDIVLLIHRDEMISRIAVVFEDVHRALGIAVNYGKSAGLWRARAANSLVLSTIQHHFHAYLPEATTISKLQARVSSFIWGPDHTAWLPAGILARPVVAGGIGLMDIGTQLHLACPKGVQVALRGVRNGFSWLVTSDAWMRPPPEGTRLQPRRLRLLRILEGISSILTQDHRVAPTTQLLDLLIIGGCGSSVHRTSWLPRAGSALKSGTWATPPSSAPRAPPSMTPRTSPPSTGTSWRRTSGGATKSPAWPRLLSYAGQQRSLPRPPLARPAAPWNAPAWRPCRSPGSSRDHPASACPFCPACGSPDGSLDHRYWSCPNIRPLVSEAFQVVGRPPDLQAWIFGIDLVDDELAILASAKSRINRYFVQIGLGQAIEDPVIAWRRTLSRRLRRFSPLAGVKMPKGVSKVIPAESPERAAREPERLSSKPRTSAEISAKIAFQKNSSEENQVNSKHANLPAGKEYANPAASRDVTAPTTAAATSDIPASLNWADSEMAEVEDNDGYTVVKGKKRRLTSTSEHAARRPGKPAEKPSSQQPKRPTGPRAVPPKEIKATRANIAEAKARQNTTSHENYVFVELCPDIPDYSYLRAMSALFGGPRGITQFNRKNGHYIVGLESKDLANRLVADGLEIEGTTLKVFPFRKRAERIVIANLPGFVEDSAVVNALSTFGRVTSIAPILVKMGEFTFTDGRREAFILLKEGVKLDRLPTRLEIKSKGDTLPAFLSFGIKPRLCLGYSAVVTPPIAISGSGLACVFGPGVAVLRQRVLWPGHIALAVIDVHGEEMTIINAHLAHDPRERLEQLELLAATAIRERAWVLGDLNIREPSSSSADALAALLDLAALVDVASQFDAAHLPTRVASRGDQIESSRLDRILVPAGVLDRVTTYATSHYHLSDHRLVLLQVGPPAVSPHQPRLAAMLRSGLALEHLAGCIRELDEDLAHDDDDGILLWDRWTTIKAGLLAEARSLHDPRHATSDGYVVRARGYIAAQLEASSIRADYPSLPDLARAIHLRRPVSVIRDDDDNVIEGPELRRKAYAIFQPRFARPTSDPAAGAAFIGTSMITPISELGEEDPLHRPEICPSEIAAAIRRLPRGKAPGWDGLPCELLAAFEDFFAEALARVFAASRLRGALPPSTRRSSICLVPKARGGRGLDGYRPIALPSADYRVLAAILHRRLKPHLRALVPDCQTYAVPGRSPSWNIARVTDAVEEATAMGSPLAVMGVDLESAFDSLDRGFLRSLMTSLRLPPAFMGWFDILYAGAHATIRAGGFHTTAFPLLNGLRQGCAVSAALFSIATGPLLRRLELTLGVGNVIAYADDIVLLLHRDEEFERVATVLEDFKRASGIAVNLGKSAGLWCGAWRNRGDSPLGASWSTTSIRVLGLDIAPRSSVAHQEQHLLALLESACRRWTPFTRGLSLVGRARAANSLVGSTIQHHLHGYLPSPPTIAKLQARLARNGFDWLVASSSEAWIRPPPDCTRLQPRRLRLLKLWEEASKILSLNHRAVPTSQLLDIPIIGGCRFLRPPDLLAPARWLGVRVRDLLAEDRHIARPTRSALADAAALGAFCRRLTAENDEGFRETSLAAAVVLRGTATPFLNGLTTRSARRALDRPRLAATPISRFLARWAPTISPPSRIDWASLRRCAFSGHEADVAFKLALHALPHPAHPASAGPSCPACGSVDRSLGHRYWSCSSIRPLIREAFHIIGRLP